MKREWTYGVELGKEKGKGICWEAKQRQHLLLLIFAHSWNCSSKKFTRFGPFTPAYFDKWAGFRGF